MVNGNIEVSRSYLKELQELHRRVSRLHDAWLGDPYGEPDEKLIEIRLKSLMEWFGAEDPHADESIRYNPEGL